jgi:hypothetical protein
MKHVDMHKPVESQQLRGSNRKYLRYWTGKMWWNKISFQNSRSLQHKKCGGILSTV